MTFREELNALVKTGMEALIRSRGTPLVPGHYYVSQADHDHLVLHQLIALLDERLSQPRLVEPPLHPAPAALRCRAVSGNLQCELFQEHTGNHAAAGEQWSPGSGKPPVTCESICTGGWGTPKGSRCELAPGHTGAHKNGDIYWTNVDDELHELAELRLFKENIRHALPFVEEARLYSVIVEMSNACIAYAQSVKFRQEHCQQTNLTVGEAEALRVGQYLLGKTQPK